MSGTLRGSIEHYITSGIYTDNVRDHFAAIVRFFDNHPQMTRIASQRGEATNRAGTGDIAGWSGDANYSGCNAFGVWRWDRADGAKPYILLQWNNNSFFFGDTPGNPGKLTTGNDYVRVGLQIALDTSGGNPWNGGAGNSDNDLLDVKGSTVWAPNGGTLLVWPRANGPSGSGATNKQYCVSLGNYLSSTPSRMQILADDDALWIAIDSGNTGGYNGMFYFGPYTPRANVTPTTDAGFIMLNHGSNESASVPQTTDIGNVNGDLNNDGGAVVLAADGVQTLRYSTLAQLDSATYQPNGEAGGFDILDAFVRKHETVAPTKYGLFGRIDPSLLAFVFGLATHDTNVGQTKVVIGGNTANLIKWLIPWDGVTTPGSGVTRNGIQF